MVVCHTVSDTRAALAPARETSRKIGFVPTMGNIHEGHLTLVDIAHENSDYVVVSVFVNPTQFDRKEDFDRYPRTLDQDLVKLADRGVDLVFAPGNKDMYPAIEPQVYVDVPEMDGILEGAHRPGHFRGVATVVSKLFNIVQPNCAVFGRKDYQQVAVIRTLVNDGHFPVEIIAADTIRESDGLAMSSRNRGLSGSEREQATALYKALCAARDDIVHRQGSFELISKRYAQDLNNLGFDVEYFVVLNEALNQPTNEDDTLVILVAAFLGKTRLIDNLVVRLVPR